MNPSELLERTVSVTEMATGNVSGILSKAKTDGPVFVLKNGKPYRAIITYEDYLVLEAAKAAN